MKLGIDIDSKFEKNNGIYSNSSKMLELFQVNIDLFDPYYKPTRAKPIKGGRIT